MIKLIQALYLQETTLDPNNPAVKTLPREAVQQINARAQKHQALAQQLHKLDVVGFCKCSYERFQKASIRDDMITGTWLSKKQDMVIQCMEKNLK